MSKQDILIFTHTPSSLCITRPAITSPEFSTNKKITHNKWGSQPAICWKGITNVLWGELWRVLWNALWLLDTWGDGKFCTAESSWLKFFCVAQKKQMLKLSFANLQFFFMFAPQRPRLVLKWWYQIKTHTFAKDCQVSLLTTKRFFAMFQSKEVFATVWLPSKEVVGHGKLRSLRPTVRPFLHPNRTIFRMLDPEAYFPRVQHPALFDHSILWPKNEGMWREGYSPEYISICTPWPNWPIKSAGMATKVFPASTWNSNVFAQRTKKVAKDLNVIPCEIHSQPNNDLISK
jgi:hypothetical protein